MASWRWIVRSVQALKSSYARTSAASYSARPPAYMRPNGIARGRGLQRITVERPLQLRYRLRARCQERQRKPRSWRCRCSACVAESDANVTAHRPARAPLRAYPCPWRGGRAVDGGALEKRRIARFRGFESHPLRHHDARATRGRRGTVADSRSLDCPSIDCTSQRSGKPGWTTTSARPWRRFPAGAGERRHAPWAWRGTVCKLSALANRGDPARVRVPPV